MTTANDFASSSFHFTSGSSGCVRIFDPPAVAGGAASREAVDFSEIAFGARTTLAYSEDSTRADAAIATANGSDAARIALFGNYMAGSFIAAAGGHGWASVLEAPQPAEQPLLTHPKT